MLIDLNDNMSEEWNCNDDTFDIDDASRIPEKDILYTPLPYGGSLGWRREQLCQFVSETQLFPHKFNFAHDVEEDYFYVKITSLLLSS